MTDKKNALPSSTQRKRTQAGSRSQKGRQARKQVENKENFASQTYPEKRIAIDREVRKQV